MRTNKTAGHFDPAQCEKEAQRIAKLEDQIISFDDADAMNELAMLLTENGCCKPSDSARCVVVRACD